MGKKHYISGTMIKIVLLLAAALLLNACITYTRVNGDSMFSTMENGDLLLINKISYLFHEPERFDIVVFSYQYKENTYYIKRIIALPGETVRITADGTIYVNGSALIEHYGNAPIQDNGLAANEITLGDDEYFVLGDNRNASTDSRDPGVGNIRKSDIVGKAWLRILPVGRFGVLE